MLDDEPPDDNPIWTQKTGMYFDRAGEEITFWEWCRYMTDDAYKTVAVTCIRNEDEPPGVSTVWLGIGSFAGPNLFESMIAYGNAASDYNIVRYFTEAEAIAGHDQLVAELRDNLAVAGWEAVEQHAADQGWDDDAG